MYAPKKSTENNEKGQLIVYVIVGLTILLAMGVGASFRAISIIGDFSDTDTAQRAQAAAEGGAENVLSLPNSDLENWLDPPQMSAICTSLGGNIESNQCRFDFAAQSEDKISTKALVDVSYFNETDPITHEVGFEAKSGQVKEIDLTNYSEDSETLDICWTENDNTGIYYIVLYEDTSVRKGLVPCHTTLSGCLFGGSAGTLDTTILREGDIGIYTSCARVGIDAVQPPPIKLRIYPLTVSNSDQITSMAVIPTDGSSLPNQGYKITSIGSLVEPSDISIKKTITVYKSFPYLPGIFDFALYGGTGITTPNSP